MDGEVVFDPAAAAAAQEAWAPLHQRAEQAWRQDPHDPAGIAVHMRHLEMLMFELADVERQVNDLRYEAESAHSRAWSTALEDFWTKGRPVAIARAMATNASLEEKRTHNEMRALWHHVDRVFKALQSKHIGYMASNKNLESLVKSWSRR